MKLVFIGGCYFSPDMVVAVRPWDGGSNGTCSRVMLRGNHQIDLYVAAEEVARLLQDNATA